MPFRYPLVESHAFGAAILPEMWADCAAHAGQLARVDVRVRQQPVDRLLVDGYPLHSGRYYRLWFLWANKRRKRGIFYD